MAAAPAQKVYILILNWNNAKDTVDCLEAVFKSDYPDYAVVCLDNGSTDDSEEKIRQWASGAGLKWVGYSREQARRGGQPQEETRTRLIFISNGENLGYAGGNNIGLEFALARGDMRYAWVLNNDTLPEAGALRSLVSCCRETGVGMAGAKLLYTYDPGVLQMAGGCRLSPLTGNASPVAGGRADDGKWDAPFDLDSVCGASVLLKKEVLEAVGAFDERYFLYWEDADWSMRARRAGFRLVYCPAARVLHKEGGTLGGAGNARADYYWVRNGLYFARKFYPGLLPLVPFSYMAKYTVIRMFRRWPLNLPAFFSGLLDFLRGRMGRRAWERTQEGK